MSNVFENPEIQSLNRLPMRSHLFPYSSIEEAANECALGPESLNFTKSKYVQSLDGQWDFTLLNNPHENDTDSKLDIKWNKIKVPGTWSLQGYDKPHYTNVQMPFDTIPPFVPGDNPTGIYKLQVKIPSEWKNRRVILHVGSAESVLIAYIDGEEVGLSKDTRLPCEFDITDYIEGKDSFELKLKVIRYSDASFIEDQDQWWFGGIHRSVYLYSTEKTYIADIEALTKLEETGCVIAADCDGIKNTFHEDENAKGFDKNGKATGLIPLYVTLGYKQDGIPNSMLDNIERCIKYTVYELEGTVQKGKLGKVVAEGEAFGTHNLRQKLNQIRIQIKIDNPKLWNHETPNLYVVAVSLCESENHKCGKLIEATAFTTGFKSVQIKGRELLINGKMVYIKGVNRHEHNEYNGKTLTTEEMVKDLHIMKSYNFNAVRTCHYPDDERWYELCNRYGMYVLDEANIENHAYYDVIARKDEWCNAYLLRIQRMVRRDKNNVCIFGWSLGNESGDGQNQVAAQAWIRRVDHTRLVHYEGFVRPVFTQGDFTLDSLARGKGLTDFIGPMYPSIDLISEYAKTRSDYRPVIMCEYSHAMGNANGSLADYWRAIYNIHGLQGGFIWDWIDQGLAAEAPAGKEGQPQGGKYWKYGGDYGDKPADYDFCLNGIMFPDQTPKPAMEECKKVFAPVFFKEIDKNNGTFEVENRFDFTCMENVTLNWKLLKNGSEISNGNIQLNQCKPNEKQKISIPTAEYCTKTDAEYVLHVEFSYSSDTSFAKKGWVFGMDEVVLNKADLFKSIFESAEKSDEKQLCTIAETSLPEIFRPLTENECVKRELWHINETPTPFAFINKPTIEWMKSDITALKLKTEGNGIYSIFAGEKAENNAKLASARIKYESVTSPVNTPAVKITAELDLTKNLSEYPCAGINLKIPADYNNVNWYGRGPVECYSDRKDGALIGMYSKSADEMEVPYIVPQENGSRCDTTYICLTSKDGKKIHIQSAAPLSFNYSKYEYDDLWKCEHHNELVDTSMGENGYYTLHLDALMRGVGTGACGPDTLEKYKVLHGTYKVEVIIY